MRFKSQISVFTMNQAREIFKATSKAVINLIGECIPIAGFVNDVYANLSQIQAERKIERLSKFLESVQISVGTIQDRLNTDYISKEDFTDIFEKTSRYIANERSEEKRNLFKNILLNSMLYKNSNYDKTERFFRILDLLGADDMFVLTILRNPSEYNRKNGMIIKDPINNRYQWSQRKVYAIEMLCQLLHKEDDDVTEIINMLFNNGLIKDRFLEKSLITNGNPIHVLDDSLTRMGIEFISYSENV